MSNGKLQSVTTGYDMGSRRNCCYTIALSEVLEIDFAEVDELFDGHTNRNGSMPTLKLKSMISDLFGKPMYSGKMSLGQLVKKYPTGRLYVHIKDHAIAVIDGKVHDHIDRGKNTKVECFIDL